MTAIVPGDAVRIVDGTALPTPGRWEVDPAHAEVAFVGRHFMLTKVRGRFTDVRGAVQVGEDPTDSTLEVVIGMGSVDSGNPTRDAHLRSVELFDVERYPEATFRSVRVDWRGSDGTVVGELTIHGTTRRVPLHVSYLGHARDPWGSDRAVFSARTRIDREDFGITWNMALQAGGVLVSKDIQIEIEVETVLQGS